MSLFAICDCADIYERNGTKSLSGIYAVNKTGELCGEASVKVLEVLDKMDTAYVTIMHASDCVSLRITYPLL